MEAASIEQALQYCLDNPDNLSTEQLLSKFPQYREELASMLAFDSQLNSALPLGMPEDSKAQIKQRLINRVTARQADRVGAADVTGGSIAGHSQVSRVPWWRRRLFAGIAIALSVAILWWFTATSLPGNPLYQVKLGTENALLNFAGDPPALIRAHVNLGNVRLVDITTLDRLNALDRAGPAFDNYRYHMSNSLRLWGERSEDNDVDLAKLLYASSVAGQRVFASLEAAGSSIPEDMRSNLQDTMTTIENLHSDSSRVLRGAGIDLDRVLQESGGTLASLLAPEPGATSPTVTPVSAPTQMTTPGVVAAPTLTAVLFAAQTTIAEGGLPTTPGIAAAETMIAGGTGTPIAQAIQTMLAQPTFVVSVEPKATITEVLPVTITPRPQLSVTAAPATVGRVLSVTPTKGAAPATLTVSLQAVTATIAAAPTVTVLTSGDVDVTPSAGPIKSAEGPTPLQTLPPPGPAQP
jgi:hypothetical protein